MQDLILKPTGIKAPCYSSQNTDMILGERGGEKRFPFSTPRTQNHKINLLFSKDSEVPTTTTKKSNYLYVIIKLFYSEIISLFP